jgi:hypothetical protein
MSTHNYSDEWMNYQTNMAVELTKISNNIGHLEVLIEVIGLQNVIDRVGIPYLEKMKIKLPLTEEVSDNYLNQIKTLTWKPISNVVWETIGDEGLDEEFNAFSPKQWEMADLKISKSDSALLVRFDDDTINKFNSFDIDLKDNYPGCIDLIDYEKGEVKIVRVR